MPDALLRGYSDSPIPDNAFLPAYVSSLGVPSEQREDLSSEVRRCPFASIVRRRTSGISLGQSPLPFTVRAVLKLTRVGGWRTKEERETVSMNSRTSIA